ncbi:MAG: homoaconitate hydratase [Thermoprotei archaeon]|nr:MAG: homoaconitate hydratase [Thermoprotei archaeon]
MWLSSICFNLLEVYVQYIGKNVFIHYVILALVCFVRNIAVSQYNRVSKRKAHPVVIYDTTLRDGEQCPRVSFSVEEKVKIAKMLDELGIPQIEAGFPVVSDEERRAVKAVTSERLNADILVLSRSLIGDVDEALKCDVDGVLIFIPLPEIHLRRKLKITYEEAVEKVVKTAEYAKEHGLFVQVSVEDATRTPLKRLIDFFSGVVEVKPDRIGLADTVGCITPLGMKYLVRKIKRNVNAKVAVHCHNDFGLATANSLAAYEAGAEAISVTVNGIGERAGNAALEEVVTALYFLYGVDLGLKLELLKPLSELVAKLSRIPLSPLKPVVGENVFCHESGIHVAAVLDYPRMYEPYEPSLVGNRRQIVFGKHSGLKGIIKYLEKNGVAVSKRTAEKLLKYVKSLHKKFITGEELISLALKFEKEE